MNKLGENMKIYTARYMGRENNDINKVMEVGYEFTFNQLKSWGLKFHKLKKNIMTLQ